MRLRLGIALLMMAACSFATTPARAAGSAVQAPATVVFPEVVLPVYDAGPRVVVTFLNAGAASVRISPPRVQGANAALFRLQPGGEKLTLGPGEQLQAVVEFLPFVAGSYRADLVLTTGEAGAPMVRTALAATARAATVLDGTLSGSRFVPVSPQRVLDTRVGLGWAGGALGAGGSAVLQLPVGAVDSAASAVVLNVTATEAAGPGFVTVWPAGKQQPVASSLNVETPGQTVANLVTVAVGTARSVAFYASGGTHLVADLAGYYLPSGATTAGRYQPVTPARLLDTRTTGGPFSPGETRALAVAGQGGVPATGASAVMLNVTVAGAGGAGFVTVWPADVARPTASNLNPDRAGQTIPNSVVVRLPSTGALQLYSHNAADLIVDVVGWFTGPTAPSSVVGLFYPVGPIRLVDTRNDPSRPPGPGVVVGVDAIAAGVTVDALAATANVTAVDSLGAGYVTAWSGVGAPPLASNLNVERVGQVIPNQVTSPMAGGRFALFTQHGTHLIVDLTGFYRGAGTS